MKNTLIACLYLMRADRPVGTVLLACPMLWALWLSSNGQPPAHIVLIFLFGAFIMRSAGCVINDFADRNFDKDVKRTKARPLTSGKIGLVSVWLTFAILLAGAFTLLALLPRQAVIPAFFSLGLACLYPFTKRFFKIPQLVLGMAYASSVLMAYMTIQGTLTIGAIILFLAVTVWTIVYDTFYAMVDRDDDISLGINSSALWFGDRDIVINALLMLVFIVLMLVLGIIYSLDRYYYFGLLLASLCFVYQLVITKKRQRDECFIAFLNNQWVGVLIFIGIVLAYLPA